MVGAAVGYGIGRFPRPPFRFHSRQEEYYYNRYMHREYGKKSSDTNDYSRDYKYSPIPETYDSYMDSCMKRTDLLPTPRPKHKSGAFAEPTKSFAVSQAGDGDTSNNTTKANSSAAESPSASAPANSRPSSPAPPASPTAGSAEDDDTVSIVEIGYPALIEQLKAKKCVELYMVYAKKYLVKQTGGAQGLRMGFQGLLAVFLSSVLMLMNSNVLMSLH